MMGFAMLNAGYKYRHARAWRGHPRLAYDIGTKKDVDGRVKPGHDGEGSRQKKSVSYPTSRSRTPFVTGNP